MGPPPPSLTKTGAYIYILTSIRMLIETPKAMLSRRSRATALTERDVPGWGRLQNCSGRSGLQMQALGPAAPCDVAS